ncbi:UDP-N-acetylglucosamine 2-epimerase (non-hydrolyzing) [uncultured Dokdonia sp.]|uniref:non-hydrolyzing UDP-N-acetylglucosamine 2-epimerase n=1 Tax=uncultured Dokdonia sp. TaxID=575653 RepID=UPI002622B359|nr:UDP-N-acetylglucosamine 2-epimerase (non-hydrolyzing) [uncultured Dokdonia sp.]
MKVVTIIGARPQFIKSGAVSRSFIEYNQTSPKESITEVIVHTGQHYDSNMSDVFFEQMDIPKPAYQLDINGLGHGAMTGQMLEEIEKVLLIEKPDWVMVYGDTNSTLAGALAASKLHIKLAHIEAGLRSFNMRMPEEVNRILTDRVSSVLFCPTDSAISNLEKEGYNDLDIAIVKNGDVMMDASLMFSAFAKAPQEDIPSNFILTTVHRAENTDDPERLKNIFKALNTISQETPVVLPLHPRTKSFIEKYDIQIGSKLHCIDPVGYVEMLYLLKNCSLVLTDSGGLQKEAYFFKKYCLTLRDETEWVELIDNGFNKLVGADFETIMAAFKNAHSQSPDFSLDLYGNGEASKKIIEGLLKHK